MKTSLLFLSFLTLVALVRAQSEINFGGLVPQSGVASSNVFQKSNNVICLNVEITQDILLKGFQYYVANARSDANLIANILQVKGCNANCADFLTKMDFIPYGTLDTVSKQFYRLATNKTGYVREVLPINQIEFVPKGTILGLLFGQQNDSSVLGIDSSKSNTYSDKFAIIDDSTQGLRLSDLKDGEKWRYLFRVTGNPVSIDSAGAYFLGWNIGSNWNSALITDFTPFVGSYLITTIKIPKNTLITGFNIHTHSAGQMNIRFIAFNECQKPNVDCDKYLEGLANSLGQLTPSQYQIRLTSFTLNLVDGLIRYDLVSPFYAEDRVYIMIDQSLGGRVSIDTSNPTDPRTDYIFLGNGIVKVSQKPEFNWKFTIRALAVPFDFVPDKMTTTSPNKSSANTLSLILLAFMLLASQLQ